MSSKFDKMYYFGGVYEDYDQFLDFPRMAEGLIANYDFESFLDIGCGCGNLVKEVKKQLDEKHNKECDVQGVDVSAFAVEKADEQYVQLADCKTLPFKENQFDLVYILGTYGYLENEQEIQKAMKEAYRVSSGLIVFEDVYNTPDASSDDFDPHRVWFLNKNGWFYTWKKILKENDEIKFNNAFREEIVITKNYEA